MSYAIPSPACVRALQDATQLCPNRDRSFDGIIGDSRHQQRKSDHNEGNAFDLTHDPSNGVDCHYWVKLALHDFRTKYVIWNREIYNVDMAEKGWRDYKGAPHDHHMHVSFKAALRDLDSPWPWSARET